MWDISRCKSRLLMISHVWPFPGTAGQQLRVRYMLEAATQLFEVDFLTFAPAEKRNLVATELEAIGCRPIVLKSLVSGNGFLRMSHSLSSRVFALRTGLKESNYSIGKL